MKRAAINGLIGVVALAAVVLGMSDPHGRADRAEARPIQVADASPMPMHMPSGDSQPPDMTAGMGPHMNMTPTMPSHPGDAQRAQKIVDALRSWIGRYQDYRVAEQDGYRPFLPNIPQKQYHFTNYANAMSNQSTFDPTRPTSLLYEKTSAGYKLIGAMYTAPRASTLADLDARVPLSIAHWHEHVNFCKGPPGSTRADYLGPNVKFGLEGSVSTADACRAAGGTFIPVIFNWMVHVYPFERDTADIWKVGRS